MRTYAALSILVALSASASGADVPASVALPSITTINGKSVPGVMERLHDVSTMIDTIDAHGSRLLVTKGTRRAGTRVGIHIHEHGGHTCVLTGEITDFVEGRESMRYPAGTCYYMPPNTPMSAANLGTEDAVLIDNFIVPPGASVIDVFEPGYPDN